MGDRTEDARGGAGANKSSCPSPSSVPVFPSHAPRTLPYTFSYVPHIMPALTLIPGHTHGPGHLQSPGPKDHGLLQTNSHFGQSLLASPRVLHWPGWAAVC